ncbi:ZIP family metal transporter [Azoarcus indigens]|uniref:ZIP family zinc transporter n=1 Tax=Azoarcus indigens TaxID=29545 RepID=A0A4R6DTF1_9RHOO|nr:ZIP family metal transporter [Azoarcus indigens]NMG68006.1 ZIP family metal transporter [Azoarcus indigens]TDN48436.1 ZIP family zinc transporter [Azoarcus indigens]
MNVKAGGLQRPLHFVIAAAAALGLLLVLVQAGHWLSTSAPVRDALAAGSLAALATALGAVPIVVVKKLNPRVNDSLLGLGAGVMLAATCFSLIVPALDTAGEGRGPWASSLIVGAGLLLGAFFLMVMEHLTPHVHVVAPDRQDASDLQRVRRLWLFVFAIVLHNVPEGLAIGVATAGTDAAHATALTTGIAIQDVPEGLVVALALLSAGLRKLPALLISAASGLVEPLAAVLGAAALGYSAPLLPWGLAFAGGAMLFVVSHEIIPESHRQGHERFATAGLVCGFVLMMILDTALTA